MVVFVWESSDRTIVMEQFLYDISECGHPNHFLVLDIRRNVF